MIVHKNLHPSISQAQDVFLPFQSKFCINQPDLNQTQLRCSKGSESDQPVTHRHKIGADAVYSFGIDDSAGLLWLLCKHGVHRRARNSEPLCRNRAPRLGVMGKSQSKWQPALVNG